MHLICMHMMINVLKDVIMIFHRIMHMEIYILSRLLNTVQLRGAQNILGGRALKYNFWKAGIPSQHKAQGRR